jgi:outer membrane protein TolC
MRLAPWLVLGLFALPALADGRVLTLQEALAAAEAPHPDLDAAKAGLDAALAERELAGAREDLTVAVAGALQRVRPTLRDAGRDEMSDNYLHLLARKPLYDFGRSANAEGAADSAAAAMAAGLLDARAQRRLEIMGRFFDVLLADLRAAADNEFMAVAYVDFDNGRDRASVGLLAPSALAELEARYQEALVKRNASQQRQRITRSLLAIAMNRPGELAPELEDPALSGNEHAVPDYEALLPVMFAHNPRFKAAREELEAARQRIEAARAERNPKLDVELEANSYPQRALNGRDDRRAGLVLTWPIYQGARVDAAVGRERALFQQSQARVEKLRLELTQALLENWLEIEQLRGTVRTAAAKYATWRDLDMERVRGEYEVELKSHLGPTMAATMEAKVRQRGAEYRLALALARLEALLGVPLDDVAKEGGVGK